MRIAHISDLHFGMNHLHIAEAFIQDLKETKPELILVSGDLTQRAKKKQFQDLNQFLNDLQVPIIIVPGNHDIPLYNFFQRLLSPFKDYNHYIGSRYPSQFHNDELSILGINSVNPLQIKDGKLSKKSLRAIKNYFATNNKKINILFFHHNFDHLEGLHKPLENEEDFLAFLKDSEVNIVCTGHLHYANVSLLYKNNEKPCLVLHAGTLLCNRSKDNLNSYYVIDINDSICGIDWRVFERAFISKERYSIDILSSKSVLEFR